MALSYINYGLFHENLQLVQKFVKFFLCSEIIWPLKLWFVIRSYGVSGLQDYIREHCRLAKVFEEYVLSDRRFEVCNTVKVKLKSIFSVPCITINRLKLFLKAHFYHFMAQCVKYKRRHPGFNSFTFSQNSNYGRGKVYLR